MAVPSKFQDVSVQLPGQVAGLGRRLGAVVIDWVACLLIANLLSIWSAASSGTQYVYGADYLLPMEIFFVEVTLFTWLFAASFGQRLLGIEVLDVTGQRLSLWKIAVRTLLVCLVLPAVIYDSQGRGLHDRAIGSVAILRGKKS